MVKALRACLLDTILILCMLILVCLVHGFACLYMCLLASVSSKFKNIIRRFDNFVSPLNLIS